VLRRLDCEVQTGKHPGGAHPHRRRIHSLSAATGQTSPKARVAVVDPRKEQAWEALRALYHRQLEDLPMMGHTSGLAGILNRVRQQGRSNKK